MNIKSLLSILLLALIVLGMLTYGYLAYGINSEATAKKGSEIVSARKFLFIIHLLTQVAQLIVGAFLVYNK